MFSRLLMRPRCEVQSATESSQICTTRTALAALEQGVGHAVVLWAIAEAIELSMESRGRPRRIDRRRGVPFASGVLRLSALPGPRVSKKKKRLGPKTTHNTRPLSDETLSRTV